MALKTGLLILNYVSISLNGQIVGIYDPDRQQKTGGQMSRPRQNILSRPRHYIKAHNI